jgi:hypothetical protein
MDEGVREASFELNWIRWSSLDASSSRDEEEPAEQRITSLRDNGDGTGKDLGMEMEISVVVGKEP